mmetsp:Transcript_50910/g.115293  ORF Transcript_50910/g.115293 Transcript_50910/m.115293 type:complete len:225 (-) Transcript_50910:583-1257(-)
MALPRDGQGHRPAQLLRGLAEEHGRRVATGHQGGAAERRQRQVPSKGLVANSRWQSERSGPASGGEGMHPRAGVQEALADTGAAVGPGRLQGESIEGVHALLDRREGLRGHHALLREAHPTANGHNAGDHAGTESDWDHGEQGADEGSDRCGPRPAPPVSVVGAPADLHRSGEAEDDVDVGSWAPGQAHHHRGEEVQEQQDRDTERRWQGAYRVCCRRLGLGRA